MPETDPYKETAETYNNLAQAYQDKFMNLDLYNSSYDLFCSLVVGKNPKILEIGCGPGNITRYIQLKRPDFIIEATDISQNMIDLARINVPTANFRKMDARTISAFSQQFEGIICGFCMPYLNETDCTILVRDSYNLLNPGGIFYFSVIEGDYTKSGYVFSSSGEYKTYLYYYSEEQFQKVLKDIGFELVQLIRIPYQKADSIETHLIFVAKKSETV